MKKIALALAAAAVLAAAGCGGSGGDGGGDTLSKEEYQTAVIEVGGVLEAAFEEIADETASAGEDIGSLDEAEEAFDALAATIGEGADALEEAADDLDELDPEEAAAANSDLADGRRALAADLDELEGALEGGDLTQILELGRELQEIATSEAGKQIEGAIEELRALGFEVDEDGTPDG